MVVRLKRPATRVVRIDPEIQDLFRIRDLQRDLARDLSYNTAGANINVAPLRDNLTRLLVGYYRRHGKVADISRLKA